MAEDIINEFLVESVFPTSTTETTVTGFVEKGVFRTGETLNLRSAAGTPLMATIRRIGNGDTPINIVREGQQTMLLLDIEPQHVVPGSRLTCRGEDEDAQATVILSTEPVVSQADAELTDNPRLEEARSLIDQRSFEEAKAILDAHFSEAPESCAGHFLMARVCLEADCEHHDSNLAYEHAKKAYEMGGSEDPEVLEVLAVSLGATGQASHGLRHLERLYERARDMDKRQAYAERIQAYRKRFKLPDYWEFLDEYGAVVYQSTDMEEIAKAIKNGSIPKNADCRKNKMGQLLELKEFLSDEHPELRAQMGVPQGGARLLDIAIGAAAGLLVAIVLDMAFSASPIISASTAAMAGAAVVLGLHKQRTAI